MARILDEAEHRFSSFGYAATTTNHIAEAAGVSVGSLYQYFPNKDAMLVALAERHIRDLIDTVGPRLARLRVSAPALEPLLEELVTLAAAPHLDDPGLHRVLFHEAPRTPELRARLAGLMDLLTGEVVWHLERLGADPRRAPLQARIMLTTAVALVHEVLLDPALPTTEAATIDEIVTACGSYGRSVTSEEAFNRTGRA